MNYIKLKEVPFLKHLFYEYYVYVDSGDYKADDIFTNKNIHISILRELYHPGDDYWLIYVKVKKKDADFFEDAMELLIKKQLISGNHNYLEKADELCRILIK